MRYILTILLLSGVAYGQSSNPIPVSSRQIADLNLIGGKSIRYLFDGNLATNINHNGVDQDDLVIPFESWIVLKNYYENFKIEFYDFSGSNGDLQITFFRERPAATSVTVSDDSLKSYNFQTGGFATWTTATGQGIENLDSVRFIRITTNNKAAFDQTITELRLFGDIIGAAPSVQRTITGSLTDPGRYGFGIGQLGDRNMHYIAMLGNNMRIINPSVQINNGADYSNALTSFSFMWHDSAQYTNGWNSSSLDSVRFYNMHYNHSIVGGSVKNLTSGQAATYDYGTWVGGAIYKKYMNVGADSMLDASFTGLGHYAAGIVAMFGNDATPARSYVYHGPSNKSYGQGGITYLGAINEWNRDWEGGVGHSGARAYHAQLQNIYDSVKVIDATMPVYVGAITSLDSNILTSLGIVHYLKTRNSTPFPADGMDFNTYMSSTYGGQAFSPTDSAVTPEQYQLRYQIQKFKTQQDSTFGKIWLNFSENGYATDTGSPFNVKDIAGKTREETQADLSARVYMLSQSVFEGIGALYYYWATSDGTYVFGTMHAMVDHYDGPLGAYSGTTLQPVGNMLYQQKTIENDYKWWSTLVVDGDSTDVNVTRKDHATDGMKKLFQVAMGTYNGTTQSYDLDLGAGVTGATLIEWSYDTTIITSTPLTITGTEVTVTAAEKKIYVEATYSSSTPIQQNTYRKRRLTVQ